VIPLSKQTILLDLYKRSLGSWRDSVKSEYSTVLRNLLIRLGVLAFMLAMIVGLAELWRRAIFRYVHDVRRRYQFMLLRKVGMWFLISIVVAFAFASELGSLATFAGLMTAGIAVALQNVILSVAGYFYLIGKYGVRVGDRVQISGVTGEVVDIGLVRLHLMELATAGTDVQPTGRVVVFSNSVVFQPTAGLYKQIPGTNFVWHQITLILAPEGNYREIESRLMGAVDSVFQEFKDSLEQQRRRMQHSLSIVGEFSLHPTSHFHLTQVGLEVAIRYPLELDKAAEIDDKITRALLEAIQRPPKLKLVGTGTPNIQLVPEPAEVTKQ
jgi:small-conductance mechanosensitive channel